MEKENAINFLLYSYFEVTLDNTEDELMKAAIARAYRDASSRVLSISDDQEKMKCKENATEYLQKKIYELESAPEYNDWFYTVCSHLETVIYKDAKDKDDKEENQAFRFGHAQKWANMTMKYLCVIKSIIEEYCPKSKVFTWLTSELERNFHIPVDSYVMEAAAKKKTQDFPWGLAAQLPNNQRRKGPYSTAKSWSNWDCDDYKVFREELNGKLDDPLAWEGPAWIEIAKIRKEREQKKRKLQKSLKMW